MNTELIEYYKDLLILQYRDKTKARGHVGNILNAGMIYDIMIAVREGFDLETAIGTQLDVLGRILGVSRTITGTTFTRAYYGYMLYGDTAPFTFNPMLLYGAESGDVQFRDYRESTQSLYDLTDEEYRVILKLAIVRNNSNASVKTIDEILNNLFGPECYFIDRMNMTVVSYMVGAKWSRIFQIAKASGLLPNPAGVGTALVVVPDINNIFGYSLYGGEAPAFAVGYGWYAHNGEFIGIGEETRNWIGIASDPEGNLWATVSSGDIYKCLAGSTTFESTGNTARSWYGITSDPDGNIWAVEGSGDIYKCLAGSTTFEPTGNTSRGWTGITSDPDGNIWATVYSGDIYKCLAGETTFAAIGGTSRGWLGITSDPEGNLWATEGNGNIYKCLAGSTSFVSTGNTARAWYGIASDPEGNLWATVSSGDIYKCLAGSTTFESTGNTARNWVGITCDLDGNIFAAVYSSDIYESIFYERKTTGCMASYS